MTKVLFVCYRHGCRGEYLSHKISTHKLFKTLEIRTVNNRTIITNDFFNKQLLSRNNWLPDIPKLPTDYNIVVPSHHFYDILKDYLPNSIKNNLNRFFAIYIYIYCITIVNSRSTLLKFYKQI